MRYKKELGQHFLTDRNIAEKIARYGEIKPADNVWEIGPGRGILTRELLQLSKNLTAFEIDEELYPELEHKFGKEIRLIKQDVLKADWDAILPEDKIRIVANIPYQITSPLIMKMINFRQHLNKIVIMIQREVAERLKAVCGTKAYSFLSIKTQFYFEVKYEFTVKPHLFFPPPKIDSAVVSLIPRETIPELEDEAEFWKVVDTSFRSRRKTLRNNLKYILPLEKVKELEIKTGIELSRRAETLSIPEFVSLYNSIRCL